MESLNKSWARRIIEVVGAHGIPPEWGSQYFSAGLDPWLAILESDYLKTYIGEDGGAAFKLVVGAYGGGKTHFLYNIREIAWKNDFVVAYVPLSKDETPFHRMELVYSSLARQIAPPQDAEQIIAGMRRGVGALVEDAVRKLGEDKLLTGDAEKLSEELDERLAWVENPGFAAAARSAMLAEVSGKTKVKEAALAYLAGHEIDRKTMKELGISRGLDRSNAFSMLRSLVQYLRNFGFRGLIVLFDEAEVLPSLSSREKQNLLANLRELVDSCGNNQFQNVMFFYAVPDYGFFEGKLNVYEALKQRLSSVFDFDNPTGVAIELERTTSQPEALMEQIGAKLLEIYRVAYSWEDACPLSEQLTRLARESYKRRGGEIGYKRLFVKSAIRLFHSARNGKVPEADSDELLGFLSQGGIA